MQELLVPKVQEVRIIYKASIASKLRSPRVRGKGADYQFMKDTIYGIKIERTRLRR